MDERLFYLISAAVIAAVYLLAKFHKTDGDIIKLAADLIPEAEQVFLDREKSGAEKMEWVADRIGEIIPRLMKCFFSEERIRNMIQFVFDRISRFIEVK